MYKVVKRDGTTVEFEISKIASAMVKAFEALGKPHHPSVINMLALQVSADFETKIKDGMITVEEIQDSVEKVLSECGYADVAKAYGVEAIRVSSAVEFKPALEKAMQANKEGRPFLVEAPMENIAVPTPGCWNINDIYRPSAFVSEGKLVKCENGRWLPPSHGDSHKPK